MFLLTAIPVGRRPARRTSPARPHAGAHKLRVLAINRADGKIVWEHRPRRAPHEASHQDNGTWASSLGDHRRGARDRVLRVARHLLLRHGRQARLAEGPRRQEDAQRVRRGSTPVLHGTTLVVVWDHPGESFVVALDKRTGKELWRVKRDEIDTGRRRSSSKKGAHARHRAGMNRVRSYDLKTGGSSGRRRPDDEPDSVAGRGGRDGVSDQRVSRQQPESDSPRGAKGRHHEHDKSCGRSIATRRTCRRRCSTTACSISSRPTTGCCRRSTRNPESRTIRCSGSKGAERLRLAGRRGRAGLHRRPRRHDRRAEARADVPGVAENTLDDGFDASPALVDDISTCAARNPWHTLRGEVGFVLRRGPRPRGHHGGTEVAETHGDPGWTQRSRRNCGRRNNQERSLRASPLSPCLRV